MRQLDVYLGESLIGRIVENRKGGRFEYEQSIVGKLAGRPVLSMAFPAKVRPFGEVKTSAWFNGLLPEGNRRDEVCRSLGVLPYDWIGLLSEIGWECAGAVRVFEHGRERTCELRLEKISPSELAEKLSSATERLPQVESGLFRMSLGGFQEKMCVVMPAIPEGVSSVAADDVLLPMGDSPSTHILKPESEHYPGLAESEAWAMTAAGNAARASKVALLDLDDAPSTLVVERYDRIADNGSAHVLRIHQEDVCQALGIDPHGKYAAAPACCEPGAWQLGCACQEHVVSLLRANGPHARTALRCGAHCRGRAAHDASFHARERGDRPREAYTGRYRRRGCFLGIGHSGC